MQRFRAFNSIAPRVGRVGATINRTVVVNAASNPTASQAHYPLYTAAQAMEKVGKKLFDYIFLV
jgi:hypothetical protein